METTENFSAEMECENFVDYTMMFWIHPRYQCSLNNDSLGTSFMIYFSARLMVLWVGMLTPDWICSNAGKMLDASSEYGKI